MNAEGCRSKAFELIALALPEHDDARRLGLLEMADHWAEMYRRRAGIQVRLPAWADSMPKASPSR